MFWLLRFVLVPSLPLDVPIGSGLLNVTCPSVSNQHTCCLFLSSVFLSLLQISLFTSMHFAAIFFFFLTSFPV